MLTIGNNHAAAFEAAKAQFGSAKFPLVLKVTNLMPRLVTLTVGEVMILRQAGHEQASGNFAVKDMDALLRCVGDVSQIAELNGYDTAMTVEAVEALHVKSTRQAAKPAPESKE